MPFIQSRKKRSQTLTDSCAVFSIGRVLKSVIDVIFKVCHPGKNRNPELQRYLNILDSPVKPGNDGERGFPGQPFDFAQDHEPAEWLVEWAGE